MSMTRTIYLTLIVILVCSLVNFIRGGADFHIAKVLPFCSGRPVSLYDWAAVAMFIITVWGLNRLRRQEGDSER